MVSNCDRSSPISAPVVAIQDAETVSIYQVDNSNNQVVKVAKDSHALCVIAMKVDQAIEFECVLDGSSEIIAISDLVCNRLGLAYDPAVILEMRSANSESDTSLGLACNVPLSIDNIMILVQVHVVKSPAYDVLLGWPFNVLTESVIRNYRNEDQMITIKDVNTGKSLTIQTVPRRRFSSSHEKLTELYTAAETPDRTATTINDSGITSAGQDQIVAQERSSLVVNSIFGQDSAVHSINSGFRTEEQEVVVVFGPSLDRSQHSSSEVNAPCISFNATSGLDSQVNISSSNSGNGFSSAQDIVNNSGNFSDNSAMIHSNKDNLANRDRRLATDCGKVFLILHHLLTIPLLMTLILFMYSKL